MNTNIFEISVIIYIILNIVENIIHYNIGKFHNADTQITLPSARDFLKIVAIMILFAFLQGSLTVYFDGT